MAVNIIKLGEKIPDVSFKVKNGAGFTQVAARSAFSTKRVIVLGVPGPFWTDFPSSMVAGYEFHYPKFLDLGIDEIYVTSTLDTFVMKAWLLSENIRRIQALPDGNGEWAQKTGLCVDMTGLSFGLRSHRYAMILENCLLKKLFYEDFTHDPHSCFTETNAERVLGFLQENQESWYQFAQRN